MFYINLMWCAVFLLSILSSALLLRPWRENGRDLMQLYDEYKRQTLHSQSNTNMLQKHSITQWFQTNLGRSVGATTVILTMLKYIFASEDRKQYNMSHIKSLPSALQTRGPKGHISCTWVQCATFLRNLPRRTFCLLIGPKNTNLVEDVEILLPVKFGWILFSGFRGEVENVSSNQRPGR